MVVLRACLGDDLEASADAVAVALYALRRNVEPVVVAGAPIHPEFSIVVHRSDDGVDGPSPSKSPKAQPRRRAAVELENPASSVKAGHFPPAPRLRNTVFGCLGFGPGGCVAETWPLWADGDRRLMPN